MDESVAMLYAQRAVTEAQPINQVPENKYEFPFFTFDFLYYFWELVRNTVPCIILELELSFSGSLLLSSYVFHFLLLPADVVHNCH